MAETWDQIKERHFKAGTTPTSAEVEAQWAGITEKMIREEIAKVSRMYPKASTIWLVPARYSDGELTVMGSVEIPYSDVRRRRYDCNCRWEIRF